MGPAKGLISDRNMSSGALFDGERTKIRAWRALALTAAVVMAGVVSQHTGTDAGAQTGSGAQSWYVDCSAVANGDGSFVHPFNNLDAANSLTLGPGEQLLFRRGATCGGMLVPKGNGALGNPIVIGAYGFPLSGPPTIDGAENTAAVWLADVSYVTVQDLELTNPGDSTQLHRGVYFTSTAGLVSGITIRNLLVQAVDSLNTFDGGKTGGGIVGQALSASGRFSNVLIEHNQVHNVSRQGITVYGTTSGTRPPATSAWPQATTGLVIRGNTVTQIQGDGIVPLGTDGALVEHNVVQQGNLAGYNVFSSKPNCAAGIWAWNANNTLIQYNEVSDMNFGPSTTSGSLNGCDGEGFDLDYNQDGTIIEYNYSHNNAGGFILLCTDQAPRRAVVRYNLSVDDNSTFSPAPCALNFNPSVSNLDGVQMYNNTIVAPTPRVTVELYESFVPLFLPFYGTFTFQNNLVVATSGDAANHIFACGSTCTNNLFYDLPTPPTATNSVTSDPLFLYPAFRGSGLWAALAFLLRVGSPAISAGVTIPAGFPPPATHDFFGAAVGNPPTIGFLGRSAARSMAALSG